MKPFILVCDGMDKDVFSNLQSISEFEVHPEPKNSQETIAELLPKATALVIRSATTVTAETLEKAPHLKLVIRAGEGTDNIDKKACEAKGVKVENTPGANNNSAAEHAVALMMTTLRHTAAANMTMKNGGWDKSKYTGLELTNKKVGIVGFGRIGQIVAKRIQGFEPEVLFFDPFIEKSELPYAKKAKDLNEIFSTCDVITLHTPLMDKTKGMINSELLNLMKNKAVLVNASRGGIVDEAALEAVLKDKKIYAAGFDVFATEPLPEYSSLRKLDNLVLTPHLGAGTEEAQLRVGKMAVDQLQEFFINNNVVNEVKA
ncbi:MAG: 3-phosphoglycerate dehydrogenase [Halobacteriovoraceae bacterium]|nr:3-phosphoglycerate dehydrogenase [Halobacteriovoraceae bacterium]